MIKSELVNRLADQYPHLYQRDVERVVNTILDEITEALGRGDRVELRGFGAFSAKIRPPRIGRNPRTGEAVAVAEKGVPCSPINSFADALKDKQVEHMGWVQPITLPNGIETKTFGPVLRINDECQTILSGPPALGEHTEAVLASLADDAANA